MGRDFCRFETSRGRIFSTTLLMTFQILITSKSCPKISLDDECSASATVLLRPHPHSTCPSRFHTSKSSGEAGVDCVRDQTHGLTSLVCTVRASRLVEA
jgi:hypothetical protein